MRTLKFIIDGQIIKKDPNCDFSGLVPGTEGYLNARFSFSPEWNGCAKVAAFYSNFGREHGAMVLEDGVSCKIPATALAKKTFYIRVFGKKKDFKITTNKVSVDQDGGVV